MLAPFRTPLWSTSATWCISGVAGGTVQRLTGSGWAPRPPPNHRGTPLRSLCIPTMRRTSGKLRGEIIFDESQWDESHVGQPVICARERQECQENNGVGLHEAELCRSFWDRHQVSRLSKYLKIFSNLQHFYVLWVPQLKSSWSMILLIKLNFDLKSNRYTPICLVPPYTEMFFLVINQSCYMRITWTEGRREGKHLSFSLSLSLSLSLSPSLLLVWIL